MQDGPSPPPTPRTAQKSSSIYQHREAPAQVAPGQGTQRRVGGDCASEGPLGQEQPRRDPSPCQRGLLVDLAPRKLCPLPSDQALAGSQKGRENTISFPALGITNTWGLPEPPEPQPTTAANFHPGRAEDPRSRGILARSLLAGTH